MHSNSSRVVHPFFHFLLFPPFIIPSFPSLFVPAVTDPSFLLQMRRLLCLGLCLAVVAFGVRAEEAAQNAEVDLADAFEELDESVKLDLARMLQDIFESELVLLGAALGVPGDRLRVGFMSLLGRRIISRLVFRRWCSVNKWVRVNGEGNIFWGGLSS